MSLSNLTIPSDLKCNSRIFRIAAMKMMSEISGEDYNLLGLSDYVFDRALRSFTRGMLGTSSIKNKDAEFYVSSFVISS